MKTVVCVTHLVPWPGKHGNEVRVQRLLQWLRARGYRIVLVTVHSAVSADQRTAVEAHVDRFVVDGDPISMGVLGRFAERLRRAAISRLSRPAAPAPDANPPGRRFEEIARLMCPPGVADSISRIATDERAVAVIAVYSLLSGALDRLPAGVLRVVDTIEVFSLPRRASDGGTVGLALAASAAEERRALLNGDILLAIQPVELEYLRELVPERSIILVGIDVPVCAHVRRPSEAGSTLGIVASNNEYNVEGVRRFLADVWPLVRARRPAARLVVAGKVAGKLGGAPAGVEFVGWVASLDEFYDAVRISVNPAVRGTGLKVKSIEALAHGRPLVTFAVGLEGIGTKSAPPWVECHDSAHMADELVRLLESDSEVDRLGELARRLALDSLGADATYAALGDVLDRAPSRQPRNR